MRGIHKTPRFYSLGIASKLLISLIFSLISVTVFSRDACNSAFSTEQNVFTWRPGIYGESLFYKGSVNKSWIQGTVLRVAEYNMYNIGEYALSEQNANRQKGHRPPSDLRYKPKSISRIIEQGQTILRANPDIIVSPEVQGEAVARDFSKRFLNDQYDVLFIKGNDVREMDLVFFVKKDLPIEIEYVSNRLARGPPNQGVQELIFSRDLPVAIVYAKGQREKPLFVLAGTHFKSKMNVKPDYDKGIQPDREGNRLRAAQVQTSIRILNEVSQYFGHRVPVMIAGDFNNNLHGQNEMMGFHRAGFKDVFDLGPEPMDYRNRFTHAYFSRNGQKEYQQVDGILLLGSQFVKIHQSGIVPYLLPDGRVKPKPRNFDERERNPSDHWMIFADMAFD